MVKSIKKQTLPTKNKPKREEGAGIFERKRKLVLVSMKME